MYRNNRQKKTQIYYQYETKYTTTQSTHKVDMPIRPVVNNVNIPSHNIAKQLNQQLYIILPLPNTYTVKNSNEIAHEIIRIPINEQTKTITLDINDMYINLPIKGILRAAKTWLQKTVNNPEKTKK